MAEGDAIACRLLCLARLSRECGGGARRVTHIQVGTADEVKVKRLQKIGLDVSCYVCGAKPPVLFANRALDGRVFFACEACRGKAI